MVLAMGDMLPDRRVNLLLPLGFGALLLSFTASRTEALMGDDAVLRAMIPHHSSAIHMCQEATLTDLEVVELCRGIVDSQGSEIAQMERMIERRG